MALNPPHLHCSAAIISYQIPNDSFSTELPMISPMPILNPFLDINSKPGFPEVGYLW